MNKKQVIVIHGGEAFDTYEAYRTYLRQYPLERLLEKTKSSEKGWKDHLAEDLGASFDVVRPSMPSPQNAKYEEWTLWFEKYFPMVRDDVILVGHSLGANFLAKYLSENDFPVRIAQLHLVAGCYGCAGGFVLGQSLEKIAQTVSRVFLYHAPDDPVVPFADAERYSQQLPQAEFISLDGRGHVLDAHFPELVARITKT